MAYPSVNYEGQTYNEWTIIKKINSQKYLCRCSCGNEKIQYIKNVLNGSTKSCGHERNKVGQKFNHWTILKELGNGKVLCQCDCEKATIKELYKKAVVNGQTKSCGCQGTGFINLKGQRFGEWTAKEFKGNAQWLCECSCGTEKILTRKELIEGLSKSCGCKKVEHLLNTMRTNFGDISTQRINNPRLPWQIDALRSQTKMLDIISKFDTKPTIKQLSSVLDTQESTVLLRIHQLELEDKVNIAPMYSSYEIDLIDFIKSINNKLIIEHSNRNILGNNQEIDIYIPELKLAIEFNGNFWHSTLNKDKKYHQQKTLERLKQGIHLIHIFEYEWNNIKTQEKLKSYIKNLCMNKKEKIYARDTQAYELLVDEDKDFLNTYHFQGYTSSNIKICLRYKNDIVSVMTFGKPRFNNDTEYQYELLRYCTKPEYNIVGGAEKLFSYFLNKYNPTSIVTYSDLSKFKGSVYPRIGFTIKGITDPNYKWVDCNTNEALSRYQTMKHRLVEKGLGTEDQTEDEIMKNLGYVKIYDSGNMKFSYRKELTTKQ